MPTELAPASADEILTALIRRAFPFAAPPPLPPQRQTPDAWETLVARARYHGLVPLLCAALDAQPRDDVTEAQHSALTDAYRSSALACATKYHELNAVLAQARAQTLPLVLLKGAALAQWLYPAPALRPFGDADVLLHQSDVPRLQVLLETRGYHAHAELSKGFGDAYYSEMAFAQTTAPRLALDAHWHLFVPVYFRARMDIRWFWARTQTFLLNAQPVLIFDPTAQLLHLTIHASLNHRHSPRLLWLYDLALLLTKHGDAIDWDDAARFARASQVTRSVREILEQTETRWGVCAPAPFLQTLKNTRIGWSERAAFALTAAEHNQARALSDALATPGAMNKVRYAARHVFPDAAYMTEHYRVSHRALLPLYYARRVLETGWKFARSIVSALASM